MKINGVTLNLNVADADEVERYEKALAHVSEKSQEIKNNLNGSESIRAQCHLIFDFFNELFGEGTDRKLFGESTDLLKCVKAFGELVTQIKREDEKMASEIAKLKKPFMVTK